MILFRPVGLEELRLVYETGMTAFPPRLPDQPIFYPVTNEGYAAQIARDWNTQSGTRAGFCTRFAADDTFTSRFERRVVGAKEHEELWVPSEELEAFNAHLEGRIEVVGAWFGEPYVGDVPSSFGLRGKDARSQFLTLLRTFAYSRFDVWCEMPANRVSIFLNFFYWQVADFSSDGIDAEERDAFLVQLAEQWRAQSPEAPPLGVIKERRGPGSV